MTYLHQRCALIGVGLLAMMILGSDGAITIPPSNKAVLNGVSNVTMSCASSTIFETISWNYVPVGGSSEVFIAVGSTVDDAQNQFYAIEKSGSKQSNLIILSATMARAGTYFCVDNSGQRAYAQLIIINSDPECSMTPNAPTELLYNQTVQMSCSISYTANTSYVTVDMIWSKDGSTSNVNSSTQTNTSATLTTATSTITPVTPGNFTPFPIYRCNTTFKLTGNLPAGSANNAPDYSKSTQLFSSPINVIYLKPADASAITGARDGDRVYLGSTVTCSNVDANPTASYNWTDVTYGNTTNSASIQIWHDGEFRCTAWNKAASTSVSINVTTYNGLSERDKIIIGVVVGVGGALLIVAVTILICCCLKKKNKADKYSSGGSEGTLSKPPPYDDNGHRGPQRSSNPDLVQGGYAMDDYPPKRSSLSSPYSTNSQHERPYIDEEGLNYAQIQLDNNPRSRQPLQMAEETNYTDVRLA